jgi:hypothetical protein
MVLHTLEEGEVVLLWTFQFPNKGDVVVLVVGDLAVILTVPQVLQVLLTPGVEVEVEQTYHKGMVQQVVVE